MDTQIDDLAIRTFLDPLGKRILKELNRKIHEKKRENWFDIYLATFIIMNNFEFVFTDVLDYTSRHGLKASHLFYFTYIIKPAELTSSPMLISVAHMWI